MAGRRYPPRIQRVCQLPLTGVDRLLDVGCGDGSFAILLGGAFLATELHGVDLSERAVALAQKSGLQAIRLDVERDALPYPNHHFDLVFAGEILEHLLDPDRLLDEAYRVLKPAGYLVLTTPNLASWYNRLQLLWGYQPYSIPASHIHRGAGAFWSRARSQMTYGDCHSPATDMAEGFPHHIRFFTAKGISALLQLHDFRVTRVIGAPADEVVFKMSGQTRGVVSTIDAFISNNIASCASRVILVGVKPSTDEVRPDAD